MAYRTFTPSTSQSPSPTSSTQVSPHINTTPLDANGSDDQESSPSTDGGPARTASLSRSQSAGKGGCWTCRVRRKKCDEVREDGSCKTCKRLTIQCLGWGAKRPDWMRDKKNVDAYKASIKAQLSRAGLIRGQPRQHPMHHAPPQRTVSSRSSNKASSAVSPPTNANGSTPHTSTNHTDFDSYKRLADATLSSQALPIMPESSVSSYDSLPSATYDPFDPSPAFIYQASLSSSSNTSFQATLLPDSLSDQAFLFHTPDPVGFLEVGSDVALNHSAIHGELVMHYFSNVRGLQFMFAGDPFTDFTYNSVVSDPRGAVSLAVCALADLHSKQMRVSQGLEVLNNEQTTYFLHEAIFKLESNKNANLVYSDTDALAALHLVSFSQLSGGASEWETPYNILCQWLMQTNLHLADNTWAAFLNLSAQSQLLAKATLWLDVFASISTLRPPKFLPLLQRLLGEQKNFWANGNNLDIPHRLRMDMLTGCPDEAILAIAEVSNLAHWKASQIHNGCLSYPELIRRGTAIEQRLRRASTDSSRDNDLVNGLAGSAGVGPSREERALISNIFRETANLYLHTVLSNSTPGVPEISSSVDSIVCHFSQLPASEVDRALIFPICFAGCMTNDSSRRDFLKNRIRNLNETVGNLLQTRRLMEAVWQKRDVGGKEVDIRGTIQEQGLMLLLI